jgi:hypothetical protein
MSGNITKWSGVRRGGVEGGEREGVLVGGGGGEPLVADQHVSPHLGSTWTPDVLWEAFLFSFSFSSSVTTLSAVLTKCIKPKCFSFPVPPRSKIYFISR